MPRHIPAVPFPEFPLRPHRNRQWFKSIWNPRTKKSEQFYFGSWSDDLKGERGLHDPVIGWLARRQGIKSGADNTRVTATAPVVTLGELMATFFGVQTQPSRRRRPFRPHPRRLHPRDGKIRRPAEAGDTCSGTSSRAFLRVYEAHDRRAKAGPLRSPPRENVCQHAPALRCQERLVPDAEHRHGLGCPGDRLGFRSPGQAPSGPEGLFRSDRDGGGAGQASSSCHDRLQSNHPPGHQLRPRAGRHVPPSDEDQRRFTFLLDCFTVLPQDSDLEQCRSRLLPEIACTHDTRLGPRKDETAGAHANRIPAKPANDLEHLRTNEAVLDALAPASARPHHGRGLLPPIHHRRPGADADGSFNESRLKVWRQQKPEILAQTILDADGTIAPTTGECKQGMSMSRNTSRRAVLKQAALASFATLGAGRLLSAAGTAATPPRTGYLAGSE